MKRRHCLIRVGHARPDIASRYTSLRHRLQECRAQEITDNRPGAIVENPRWIGINRTGEKNPCRANLMPDLDYSASISS